MNELQEKLHRLAEWRENYRVLNDTYTQAKRDFEQELSGTIDLREKAKVMVEELEADVRAAATRWFEETGEKKPLDEIVMRREQAFVYDAFDVKQALIASGDTDLLALDVSAFEQRLKRSPAFLENMGPLVSTATVYKPAIATRLGHVLIHGWGEGDNAVQNRSDAGQ